MSARLASVTPAALPGTAAYVSRRWRTLFVVTPKAACTSVLWAFARLQEEPLTGLTTSLAPETTRALLVHDPQLWQRTQFLHRLSERERQSVLGDDGWFRFALTRHPVDRLWSAWQSKLLLREPAYLAHYGSRSWFPRPPASLEAIVEDFAHFVSALTSEPGLLDADAHWRPQTRLLAPGSFPYTHLGRVESLDATLDLLRRHLTEQGRGEPLRLERRNAGLLACSASVRDPGLVAAVEELYREDLEAFGYEPSRLEGRGAGARAAADVAVHAMAALVERHDRIGDLQRVAVARSKPGPATRRSSRDSRTRLSLIVLPRPGQTGEQAAAASRADLNVAEHVEIVTLAPSQAGLAARFQAGCDAATGEVVVLCRELVGLTPGWADAVRRGLARPAIGAVGAALTPDDSPTLRLAGLRFVDDLLSCHWRVTNSRAAAPDPRQRVAALSSTFLALRAQTLRDVGGLDVGMLGDTCHDIELCMRLWRRGLACEVLPAVTGKWRAARHRPDLTGRHLHDLLRMAAVHLPTDRWARMLEALRLDPELPQSLAQVLTSDVGALRAQLEAAAANDFEAFWARCGAAPDRESRRGGNVGQTQRRQQPA